MNTYLVTYKDGEVKEIKAVHFSLNGTVVEFHALNQVIAMISLDAVRTITKQD